MNPGSGSFQSPKVRTGTARRIAGLALARVRGPSTRPRAMASIRSIVDALTARTLSRMPASSWMPVAFEGREKHWHQCLKPLAADAIGGLPQNDENLAHRLVVEAQSRGSHRHGRRRVVVQDPDRVFAVVSGDRNELVQDPQLVFSRCLPVSLADRSHQLSTSIHADSLGHPCILRPATAGSRFGESTTPAR